jgi:hypothetical protein
LELDGVKVQATDSCGVAYIADREGGEARPYQGILAELIEEGTGRLLEGDTTGAHKGRRDDLILLDVDRAIGGTG